MPAPSTQTSPPTPLRRIVDLALPERRNILLGALFLALSSGMTLLIPRFIGRIVDGAQGEGGVRGATAAIDGAAGWLLLVLCAQALGVAMRFALFNISGERVILRLRARLFDSLMAQEIAFFDERRTGELLNRLGTDTGVLQSLISANISMALRFSASVVGGIAFLFYLSPRLTLLMLAVIPVVALGAVANGRRIRRLARAAQDALARSGEVAEEAIAGIRTVRSFAAEKIESRRYSEALSRSFELSRHRILAGALFMGVGSFAAFAAAGLVLWYGGRLVGQGALSVGDLTSFIVYTLLVAHALGGLSDLWADVMKATGAAARVFEIIDSVPGSGVRGDLELPEIRGKVEFESIAFSYPARRDMPVLKEIDLSIEPGELVAVVGPSGAGKSTVASLLLRLYEPQSGRILLDSHDIQSLSPDWLRRQIAIVSQEPLLFSGSIADNIRYGRPDAAREAIEEAARAANAHDYIAKFPQGYDTLVGERGVQLSGGQKQRVAIARAMLKDPRLLVLDEATSALDAESEHLVQEALDRLMRGRSTLVIAHRLSTIAHADRVLVLDGGRIVQSGDHASLLAQDGLYRRLVERQFVSA